MQSGMAMASGRAGRVYVGRLQALDRRGFLRELRYLKRDGRHSAVAVLGGKSIESEVARIDHLAATMQPLFVTSFVASFGAMNVPATAVLRIVRTGVVTAAPTVHAGMLIAHGLPQEQTMRHAHGIIVTSEPLNARALFQIIDREWALSTNREQTVELADEEPHVIRGSRRSESRLRAIEELHGELTFRRHVAAELEAGGALPLPPAIAPLERALEDHGLRYRVGQFEHGIIESSDRQWHVAASLVHPDLAAPALLERYKALPAAATIVAPHTYPGRIPTDEFTDDERARHARARDHFTTAVQPALEASLDRANDHYRTVVADIRDTRDTLRTIARDELPPHAVPQHLDVIEQFTTLAKANAKAAWFQERAAVYAAHERAPDRAIGRFLSHRPPAAPPSTDARALQTLDGVRRVPTEDGEDFYLDGMRIGSIVAEVAYAIAPEALTMQTIKPHVQELPEPQPELQPVIVSGTDRQLAELAERFRPALVAERAMLFQPTTREERNAIENAALERGLSLGDPYALARLEREGVTPQEKVLSEERKREEIQTRERRRRR